MIKKAGFLKDVPEPPRIGRHKNTGRIVLPDAACHNDAPPGVLKARDAAQHRRLAAARGSEKGGDAVLRNVKGNVKRKPGRAGEFQLRVSRHTLTALARRLRNESARSTAKEKTSMPPASQWALSYSIASTKV